MNDYQEKGWFHIRFYKKPTLWERMRGKGGRWVIRIVTGTYYEYLNRSDVLRVWGFVKYITDGDEPPPERELVD
jgi:hypothetical protein